MTDLDKIIERINYIRQQGFITQNEAQELRNLARSRASAKGALGPADRDIINQAINTALNKKGQEAKQDGGLKPPTTTRPPGGGGGNTTRPPGTTRPPTTTKPPSGGGDKWDDFLKGYNKLTEKNDRDVIRGIFGGNPANNFAFWNSLSKDKKEFLVSVVKDGKVSGDEKRSIERMFPTPTTTKPPTTKPPTSKPPTTSPPTTEPPDDDTEDDDTGDGGDGEDDDDTPDTGPGEPTVKGGGKKIDIPKPGNRANYELDENAQRLSMPNIDRKITREIERVTLRLINVTKEFIEGGMDFYGIDYVAENEILGQDGNPYYPLPDYNSPGEENSGFAEERAEEVKLLIEEILSKGDKDSQNYNYLEYLDLFELRYNGVGDPVFRFSLELTGSLIEDLTVLLVEEDPNLE
jgi:hypothetical protein